MRIAAEGRKFGPYLLISTQRPEGPPDNVLPQARAWAASGGMAVS